MIAADGEVREKTVKLRLEPSLSLVSCRPALKDDSMGLADRSTEIAASAASGAQGARNSTLLC